MPRNWWIKKLFALFSRKQSRRSRRSTGAHRPFHTRFNVTNLEDRVVPDATFHSLAGGNFSQDWTGTDAALTTDNWANIPSIIGYRGDGLTNSTSTNPWTTLADGSGTPVNLIANSSSTSGTGGVHEIANDVVALQGSGTADAPHFVLHLNATGRENLTISYDLRELDSTTVDQKFALQYRIGGTGSYTDIAAFQVGGFFNTAGNQTKTFTSVVLPAALNNQAQVQLRLITNDAPSSDAMVGWDNIVVSSVSSGGGDTVSVAATDANKAEGDSGTTPFTFTVTRTGTGTQSVDWAVTGSGANPATADDFVGGVFPSGTVNFTGTDTTAVVTVNVNGDTDVELNEGFTVTLSNPTGGLTLGTATAAGTIVNDDTPAASGLAVFINEFHYDNTGTDVGEFIEIAGPAGTDLTGWSLVRYNGATGLVYTTPAASNALPATIPDSGNGFGFVVVNFAVDGLQNGGPDGFALVNASNQVVQFLSYEGSFAAVDGPAAGLTSTDVGVSEPGNPVGESLQLTGTGRFYADFVWAPSAAETVGTPGDDVGAINNSQVFNTTDAVLRFDSATLSQAEGNSGTANATITVRRSGNLTSEVTVQYATSDGTATAGSDYTAASGTLTFLANQETATFVVPVIGDTTFEANETVNLTLSNPQFVSGTGGAILGTPALTTAVLTITNDEAAPTGSAINYAGGTYTNNFDWQPSTPVSEVPLSSAGPLFFSEGPFNYGTTQGNDTAVGWNIFQNGGTGTTARYFINDGATFTNVPAGAFSGGVYDWGVAATNPVTDRALGLLGSGSTTMTLGATFANTGSTTYTAFTLNFTQEQWAQISSSDTIPFSYAIGTDTTNVNTGTFTPFTLGDLTPIVGATDGLDGNAAANRVARTVVVSGISWAPGQNLTIRWVDSNTTGNDAGYAIDDLSFTATDTPPAVVQFDAATYTLAEDGGTATVTVTRTGDTSSTTTVDYLITDINSEFNADYTTTPMDQQGTLTFGVGETTKTIVVTGVSDTVNEGTERFTITLSNATGGSLGVTNTTKVFITDNDPLAAPVFFQESFETAPGTSYTLEGPTTSTNVFNYFGQFESPDNTNVARDDFQAGFHGSYSIQGQHLNGSGFTAGESTRTITIPNINIAGRSNLSTTIAVAALNSAPAFNNYEGTDGIRIYAIIDGGSRTEIGRFAPGATEGDLFLDADLNGVGEGTRLTTALADFSFVIAGTGTTLQLEIDLTSNASFEPLVVDNVRVSEGAVNPGTLQFGAVAYATTEGNTGTKTLTVTITRVGGTTGAVDVTVNSTDGTATAGSDYVAIVNQVVSFANGETSKTFDVVINGDTTNEADETLTLTLSNPTAGATLGTPNPVTVTIQNEDQTVFINEIHYDNASTDVNEGIEIAGPAGTDLTGWSIVAYNGNGGGLSTGVNGGAPVALSGTIPNQDDGYGTLNFLIPNLENGSPDGVALVDNLNNVVQFLSWEGSFIATAGAATGLTSVDIGVSQPGTEAVDLSLQLQGTGTIYSDFVWSATSIAQTRGLVNTAQDFAGATSPGTIQFNPATVLVNEAAGTVTLTLTRTGGSTGAVSVTVNTTDGSAVAPGDYTALTSQVVNFADGETTKTVVVSIINDTDVEGNESFTATISAPTGGAVIGTNATATVTIADNDAPPVTVFINEIHYDNDGADADEGIEIAGPAGTDLTGWTIALYNGGTTPTAAVLYNTITLSGTIPNQDDGYGTLNFPFAGIQNGPTDGLALINASNQVVQFLSYEGVITASDGPAVGLTSTDIVVSEPGNTPLGESLQLIGTGTVYSDFTWSTPIGHTRGAVNTGQDFVGTPDTTPPTLVSINDNDADDLVAVNTPVNYTVTFSEDILDGSFTAADLDNAGTAAISIGTITETSPGVFSVQVTPTSAGTIILRIPTGSVVEDVAGNDLVVPVQDDTTVTVDATAPTVTITDNVSGGPVTVGAVITYTATFSEPVTGVEAGDFSNFGTASGTFANFTAVSSTVYTIQFTTTGAGTAILRINNAGAVIEDTAGNDLATPVNDDTTITVNAATSNGVFELSSSTYTTNEGIGTFLATVIRTGGSTGAVTLPFSVSSGTATATNDYVVSSATPISFAAGQTSATIAITIVDDGSNESNEAFSIVLGTPSLGTLGSITSSTVTITDPILVVSSLTPTNSGFKILFNRAVDTTTLNLYDSSAGGLGAADVTVTGGTTGAVRGSLIVTPAAQVPGGQADRELYFIRTGAGLAADTYTVAIRSAADGLKDRAGVLLDGDNNTTAGGDYSANAVVSAPSQPLIASLGDLTRGPTQALGTALLPVGLPLTLSSTTVNGNPITAFDIRVAYDPALFTPTDFIPTVSGYSGAFNANYATLPDGRRVMAIAVASATALPGSGPIQVGYFVGSVPSGATYAAKQVLSIIDINTPASSGGTFGFVPQSTVFDNTTFLDIPLRGDEAVHLVAYFADTNGSQTITGGDASLVNQVAVGNGTGFPAYQNADPVLIADTNGSNTITGGDASLINQKAVGLPLSQIPDAGPAGNPVFGPDPRLSIGNATGEAGGIISVPINFLATETFTPGLSSLQVAFSWDPSVFTYVGTPTLGAYMNSLPGWSFGAQNIDNVNGTARIVWNTSNPEATTLVGAGGEALVFTMQINSAAAPGNYQLNLRPIVGTTETLAENNNGALLLVPAPTVSENDEVDGTVTVQVAATPTATVFIPNLNVAAGESFIAPLNVQFNNATTTGFASIQYAITWDPTLLTVTGTPTLGASLAALPGWSFGAFNLDNVNGTLRIVANTSSPGDVPAGTLYTAFNVPFTVVSTATAGTTFINIANQVGGTTPTLVEVNGGTTILPLDPAPTSDTNQPGVDSVVTITVSPNQPPFNGVPGAQQFLSQAGPLVFSAANGNAITVSDPDAGTGLLTVTLTTFGGTLTLGSTTAPGLNSIVGDGTGNITISGTIDGLNTAMDGLTYTPNAGFYGTASIVVNTNDNGNGGFGGPTFDIDSVSVTSVGLFISEILLEDNTSSSSSVGGNEYIEIYSTAPNFTIPAGTFLVGIEGDTGALGALRDSFDLGGFVTGANGYLALLQRGNGGYGGGIDPNGTVVANVTGNSVSLPNNRGFGNGGTASVYDLDGGGPLGTKSGVHISSTTGLSGTTGGEQVGDLKNASISFLLIQSNGSNPTATTDIDGNNDGVADGVFADWTVFDSVAVLDGGVGDASYAQTTFRNGANGIIPAGSTLIPVGFTGNYVARLSNLKGASDWIASNVTDTGPAFTLGAQTSIANLAGVPLDDVGGLNIISPTVTQVLFNGSTDGQRSQITWLQIDFSTVINLDVNGDSVVDDADIALAFGLNRAEGGSVGFTYLFDDAGAGFTSLFLAFQPGTLTTDFAIGDPNGLGFTALVDGNYTLTVSDLITDLNTGLSLDGDRNGIAGGDFSTSFHRLFGDVTGEGVVDNDDAFLYSDQRFGTWDTGLFWFFDFNGDGILNEDDDNEFLIRYA